MVIFWLIAGTIMVSVPYYIFYNPYDLWPSVISAGIGAALYLIALFINTIRSQLTGRYKMITTISGVLVLAMCFIGWSSMYQMSHYQRSTLNKIRTVIAEGIFLAEDINDRATPVFVQYHKQTVEKKGIVTLFKNMHGGKMKGEMFPTEYPASDPSKRLVRFFGDTMVVLNSVDTVAQGMNREFANFNGSVGRVQTTTILTAKGVTYERNN